mmetsp:Transcript_4905/g.13783  ORF Transcript_4905/g.13783 Transcript_4905/m.13783 type:complete len:319 (-) Transcript_4905:111-1067(-)
MTRGASSDLDRGLSRFLMEEDRASAARWSPAFVSTKGALAPRGEAPPPRCCSGRSQSSSRRRRRSSRPFRDLPGLSLISSSSSAFAWAIETICRSRSSIWSIDSKDLRSFVSSGSGPSFSARAPAGPGSLTEPPSSNFGVDLSASGSPSHGDAKRSAPPRAVSMPSFRGSRTSAPLIPATTTWGSSLRTSRVTPAASASCISAWPYSVCRCSTCDSRAAVQRWKYWTACSAPESCSSRSARAVRRHAISSWGPTAGSLAAMDVSWPQPGTVALPHLPRPGSGLESRSISARRSASSCTSGALSDVYAANELLLWPSSV